MGSLQQEKIEAEKALEIIESVAFVFITRQLGRGPGPLAEVTTAALPLRSAWQSLKSLPVSWNWHPSLFADLNSVHPSGGGGCARKGQPYGACVQSDSMALLPQLRAPRLR